MNSTDGKEQTMENSNPLASDVQQAMNHLLQSNDFNVRNLRNLVRAQMTGGDCFDLVGLARVLAKYAEPELSALRQWKREMIAVQELHEHLRPQIEKLLSPKQLGKPWMQGVLDELASLRSRLAEVERDREKDEEAHLQTIDERDKAEEALSQAYYLIIGESPEWSNLFGHDEALNEIDLAQKLLRESLKKAESRLAEVEKERDAAQKLVAEMRQSGKDMELWYVRELANAANDLDVAESALAKMQWVSVEERLPEGDERYLVARNNDWFRIQICSFHKGTSVWDRGFYDDGEMDTNVTHWRPLPEPPGAALGRDKEG